MLANRVTEFRCVLWCLTFSTALKKKRCCFCYLKLCNIYHVLWRRNYLCTFMFSPCMPCMLQICSGVGMLAEQSMQHMPTEDVICQLSYSTPLRNTKSTGKKAFLHVDFYISIWDICVDVLCATCTVATVSHMELLHICHMAYLPVDSGHLSK